MQETRPEDSYTSNGTTSRREIEWHCTAIDLFGPFKIRDEVKKRTTGKVYGVIFNCLGTRAVQVELAPDYSTIVWDCSYLRHVYCFVEYYSQLLYCCLYPQQNVQKNVDSEVAVMWPAVNECGRFCMIICQCTCDVFLTSMHGCQSAKKKILGVRWLDIISLK